MWKKENKKENGMKENLRKRKFEINKLFSYGSSNSFHLFFLIYTN